MYVNSMSLEFWYMYVHSTRLEFWYMFIAASNSTTTSGDPPIFEGTMAITSGTNGLNT